MPASTVRRSRSPRGTPSLEDEGIALIQRFAKVQRSREPLQEITNKIDPHSVRTVKKPHVNDRWCATETVQPIGTSFLQTQETGQNEDKAMQKEVEVKSPADITLCELIPPPAWLHIPCSELQFLATQLQNAQLGPVNDSSQVVKWHSSTLDALQCLPTWNGEIPTCYKFYTDGSSVRTEDGRRGASAVVLIVSTYSFW